MAVSLDDSTIRSLAKKTEVLAVVPELSRLVNYQSNCSACQKSKQASTMLSIKMTLANLSQNRAEKLKMVLNTDKITIKYVDNGKQVEKTY